jgi:hypothetical protein
LRESTARACWRRRRRHGCSIARSSSSRMVGQGGGTRTATPRETSSDWSSTSSRVSTSARCGRCSGPRPRFDPTSRRLSARATSAALQSRPLRDGSGARSRDAAQTSGAISRAVDYLDRGHAMRRYASRPRGSMAWFAHRDPADLIIYVDVRGPTYKGSLTGDCKSTLAPLRALRARTSEPAWARRVVDEGLRSCLRAGCRRSACPVRPLLLFSRQ